MVSKTVIIWAIAWLVSTKQLLRGSLILTADQANSFEDCMGQKATYQNSVGWNHQRGVRAPCSAIQSQGRRPGTSGLELASSL